MMRLFVYVPFLRPLFIITAKLTFALIANSATFNTMPNSSNLVCSVCFNFLRPS